MTYRQILEANRDNADLLKSLVREINRWDGRLGNYEAYDFDDEFFNTYFEGKPQEAARAVFFGSIGNWLDDYIRFDGYGNLESLNTWRYEEELREAANDIIEAALALADKIELKEVLEHHDIEPGT